MSIFSDKNFSGMLERSLNIYPKDVRIGNYSKKTREVIDNCIKTLVLMGIPVYDNIVYLVREEENSEYLFNLYINHRFIGSYSEEDEQKEHNPFMSETVYMFEKLYSQLSKEMEDFKVFVFPSYVDWFYFKGVPLCSKKTFLENMKQDIATHMNISVWVKSNLDEPIRYLFNSKFTDAECETIIKQHIINSVSLEDLCETLNQDERIVVSDLELFHISEVHNRVILMSTTGKIRSVFLNFNLRGF